MWKFIFCFIRFCDPAQEKVIWPLILYLRDKFVRYVRTVLFSQSFFQNESEMTLPSVLVSGLRSHGTRITHAKVLPEEPWRETVRRCAPHQHAQVDEVGSGTETSGISTIAYFQLALKTPTFMGSSFNDVTVTHFNSVVKKSATSMTS